MWKPWIIEKIVSKGDYNYAVVREHPNATKNGYVLHHRVVMENKLKRLLTKDEVVHHKDERKKHNVSSNLKLHTRETHSREHALARGRMWVTLKCPTCDLCFDRTKNQTHLSKPSKYAVTCCSSVCRGKLYATIQNHGMTGAVKRGIKQNIIKVYRRY